MKRTISGMVGRGSLAHNNRSFSAENIDRNRTSDNITYLNEDLQQVYEEMFGEALERHNAKQTRNDRKISNYYEHIRSGKQEKLFHEGVFQMGNVGDTAVGTPEWERGKAVLDEFMRGFQERNPHLRVFAAHLHMDEATPHLHIDFVPFTTGSKRGLETRVSMKKALAAQGFMGGSREDTELNQWINSEKLVLSQVMERHGIEWEQKGTHHEHLSVLDYKKQERQVEVKALEKSILKLQQQHTDIEAVEKIAAKPVPLSSKVMVERVDFENVVTAAKKYVTQEKKENKLERLLKAANNTIATLKSQIVGLTQELAKYRSIRGQLQGVKLEKENKELRQKNSFYRDIIERNSLSHLLGGQRGARKQQERDSR